MNILITGGHTGIGLELSKLLLKDGHHIGLVVRNEKRKNETAGELGGGDKVDYFYADLSNQKEVVALADEVKNRWTRLDGIFNNAGVLRDQAYESPQGNEMHFEVNALAPYLLTYRLKDLLDKSDAPFVVNTSTVGMNNKKVIDVANLIKPKKFVKLLGAYIDSKFAGVVLMNELAAEWPKGKFVNLNPGAIKTKMTAGGGMPKFLLPLRNLLFGKPIVGAERLKKRAFDAITASEGPRYFNEDKLLVVTFKPSAEEKAALLACIKV